MRIVSAISVAVFVLVSACASQDKTNFKAEGVKKAAFDLGCDEDKVSFKEVSETQVDVSGCGKKATYRQRDGSWQSGSVKSE